MDMLAPNVSPAGSPLNATPRSFLTTAINLNSAAADVGSFTLLPLKYRVIRLMGFDASTSLTLATLSLFTGAGGTGTAVVSVFALAGLSAATKFVDCTLAVTADYLTAGTLYLRNITAQGGAATASFILEILPLV